MQLTEKSGIPRERRLVKLSNCGGYNNFACFNTDIKCTTRGILERLFFVKKNGHFDVTHKPTVRHVHNTLFEFKCGLIKGVGLCYPISKEQVPLLYTGRKRTIYQNAYESLMERPLRRSDSYLSTFVKVEKTDFTAKSDPVPRIIQPRNPRYHLLLATFLKSVEHLIYKTIDKLFGHRVVAKGNNAIERGQLLESAWNDFKDPVAIAADAKRFDQHVSEPMLKWEHSIYKHIFKNSNQLPLLRKLLSWQCANVGYANCPQGVIKYSINGCRMSGDINTALGNVIIMCAMFYSYLKRKPKSRFINDGDDCVLIVERSSLHEFDDLTEYFSQLGFTMELDKPVSVLEQVDFCQCRPVKFVEGYRMVRNFEPCLTKDLHTLKSVTTELALRTQLKSIAMCGMSIASDCPIYGAFYKRMLKQNKEAKIDASPERDGKFWLSQRMPALSTIVLDETRASFFMAFGITPDLQREYEKLYSRSEYPFKKLPPCSHNLHK